MDPAAVCPAPADRPRARRSQAPSFRRVRARAARPCAAGPVNRAAPRPRPRFATDPRRGSSPTPRRAARRRACRHRAFRQRKAVENVRRALQHLDGRHRAPASNRQSLISINARARLVESTKVLILKKISAHTVWADIARARRRRSVPPQPGDKDGISPSPQHLLVMDEIAGGFRSNTHRCRSFS
jgi:hypothetical protein